MDRKKTLAGVALILTGVALYLRNFHITTSSSITLFIGLFLIAAYIMQKQQPFIIFGGIFTAIGLMSLLEDLNPFRINITFEIMLIVLGLIFIFLFYSRNITGFVFPGFILPALGVYFILIRTFGERYMSPSLFLLLGFAFYVIYFVAYIGKSNWPLIPATILLAVGILAYSFRLGILDFNMILLRGDYIWPLVLIFVGALILFNRLFRKSK
ncbi:MAG: LiaF transmembrane domain-containing protein [Caulobacteraceae bacterium]